MTRLGAVTGKKWDVLIVGGGIQGLTLAEATAARGLQVALIDQGDYGAGASANSLKILHGGLRYLQYMDVPRMRESIAARRQAFLQFPHLAHPTPFLAPVGNRLIKSAMAYRIAALLNDLVSAHRNRGVPHSHQIPRSGVWSAKKWAAELPDAGLPAQPALHWFDGFIENTERYTLDTMRRAQDRGATTLNYTRALGLLRDGTRVIGVRARDEETGDEAELRAELTVNAAGLWIPELWPGPTPPQTPCVRAYNLIVRRSWFGPYGVGLEGMLHGTRRNFFFAPWRDGTIIGTVYKPYDPARESCTLSPSEIEAFIQEINTLYPAARLSMEDVTSAHVGILPAQLNRQGHALPDAARTARLVDFRKTLNVDGLWAVQNVKFTTAAIWADRIAVTLATRIGRPIARQAAGLDVVPLYSAEQAQRDAAQQGWMMDPATAIWAAAHYGSRAAEWIELGARNDRLRELIPGTVMPYAVISYALELEQAHHLADLVLRRTDLGTFEKPNDTALSAMAEFTATTCGWSEERKTTELALVKAHYQRLGVA